ncbi:MAG: Rieske 2Fe-2S domain-containing protein [Thermoprotei archaeon]
MPGQTGFVQLAKAEELEQKHLKAVRVNGKHYVIVEHKGSIYCFDGLCPHAEGLLGFGQVQGRYLYCTYHQAVFDVTTGKPLAGSPTDIPLRSYPVKVENGFVYAMLE